MIRAAIVGLAATVARDSDRDDGEQIRARYGMPIKSPLGAHRAGARRVRPTQASRPANRLAASEAIDDDTLIHETPAIVGCRTPSAVAHPGAVSPSPS